ncbi:MAG: TonB-dependent receptor [Acidiphilium sp.]|nr:TonB-dependent receptor [Acidiphilium sp.]MDD4935647.1 TonB-dependent receptor [Acidiphilium sp.]
MIRFWFLTGTALSGMMLFGAMATASAQVVTIPGNTTPVKIKGVSKSASKIEHSTIPQKATYSESTIGKRRIETASPAANAQTLLNQLPSIVATSSGPNGMRTNIQFRAFNDGQFSETFDGVALNDLFNAGVVNAASARNNTLITLDDFQQVKIYRGVNNPAVNSYNSLGGTINYVPREASATANGQAGISYGSFNSFGYHVRLNTGDVGGVRQLFSFHRDISDSWLQNGKDQNNNFYYTFNAPTFGGTGKVYGYFIYNHNLGETPHTVPLALVEQYGTKYQFPLNDTYSHNIDTNYLAVLGASQNFTPNLSGDLKFFFGADDYVRTSFSNPYLLQGPGIPYQLPNAPASYKYSPYPGQTSYDPLATFGSYATGSQYHYYGYYGDEVGIQPQFTADLPYNTIVFGGNLTSGHLHSREYWYGTQPVPIIPGYNNAWNEHDLRTLASVYIQDKISLLDDRLTITPGVKYLNAITKDHDATGFYYPISGSVSDQEHFTSPTIGASFAFTPHIAAYAAFGENIKFPDISAYYGNIGITDAAGQPIVQPLSIKPEYVKDYEAGLRYTRGGLTAAVDYYRENFTNTFINSTSAVTGASTTTNGGSSRYDGEELQVLDHAGRIAGLIGDWSAYFNYAHNNANFLSSFSSVYAGTVQAGQPLANVPQNLLSGGATWTHDGWMIDGNAQYVGIEYLQQGLAGTPTSLKSPPYFLLNVAIQKTIPLHLGRVRALRVAFNVDNLLGRQYYTTDKVYQDNNGNNYQSVLLGTPRAFYLSLTALF